MRYLGRLYLLHTFALESPRIFLPQERPLFTLVHVQQLHRYRHASIPQSKARGINGSSGRAKALAAYAESYHEANLWKMDSIVWKNDRTVGSLTVLWNRHINREAYATGSSGVCILQQYRQGPGRIKGGENKSTKNYDPLLIRFRKYFKSNKSKKLDGLPTQYTNNCYFCSYCMCGVSFRGLGEGTVKCTASRSAASV